jgi:hypothetical protein
MERIIAVADQTIRRACGFAAFAVGATMLALSFDLVLALRVGAVMTTAVGVVLFVQSVRAPQSDVRRTELYGVVGRSLTLPRDRTQRLLGEVLAERYLWHADRAAAVAIALWAGALLLWLLRMLRAALMPTVP